VRRPAQQLGLAPLLARAGPREQRLPRAVGQLDLALFLACRAGPREHRLAYSVGRLALALLLARSAGPREQRLAHPVERLQELAAGRRPPESLLQAALQLRHPGLRQQLDVCGARESRADGATAAGAAVAIAAVTLHRLRTLLGLSVSVCCDCDTQAALVTRNTVGCSLNNRSVHHRAP